MPFKKGHNKSNGRPKGSANKATQKVRDSFALLLEDNLDQLKNDIDSIEKPEQRVRLLLDLAKYVIPQLKQTEFKANEDGELTIPVIKFTKSGD